MVIIRRRICKRGKLGSEISTGVCQPYLGVCVYLHDGEQILRYNIRVTMKLKNSYHPPLELCISSASCTFNFSLTVAWYPVVFGVRLGVKTQE